MCVRWCARYAAAYEAPADPEGLRSWQPVVHKLQELHRGLLFNQQEP